jgi:hypothetical protein
MSHGEPDMDVNVVVLARVCVGETHVTEVQTSEFSGEIGGIAQRGHSGEVLHFCGREGQELSTW